MTEHLYTNQTPLTDLTDLLRMREEVVTTIIQIHLFSCDFSQYPLRVYSTSQRSNKSSFLIILLDLLPDEELVTEIQKCHVLIIIL